MTSTTPGLVCAHHHLYSCLARDLPAPRPTPTSFREILELVWWRMDVAMDLEMLHWSAMLGAVEALEAGTTALVDHNETPSAIEGSLSVIGDACRQVGVRVICAYGVTDRHGLDGARRGLAENERFLKHGGRGMVGLHAAFTCSDKTLDLAAGLAVDSGTGVHLHVAESQDDASAPERLSPLSDDRWVLAHGVHLPDRSQAPPAQAPATATAGRLSPLRGIIVHNPSSNMNNGVGYARPARFANPVALGTDGIGGDMLSEFRMAYLRSREDDVTATADTAWAWLGNGYRMFPEALFDEVTWSHDTMTPGSIAFTPHISALRVVMDGEVVLRDGMPTRVDAAEVRAKAKEQARRLVAKMEVP
ncbi:MAG: amidohydrolase family protein [Acidimicrobiales bacterium]